MRFRFNDATVTSLLYENIKLNKSALSHDSLRDSDDISIQVAFVLSALLELKVLTQLKWIKH